MKNKYKSILSLIATIILFSLLFSSPVTASEKKLTDEQYQDLCVYFERWYELNDRKRLVFTSDVNEPSRRYSKKMKGILGEDENLYKQFFTRFFADEKYKEHLLEQAFFFNGVIAVPKDQRVFFSLCRFFAEENGKLMDLGISYFKGETYHSGPAREYFDWVVEREEEFKKAMRDSQKRELELDIYDEKRKQRRYRELSDEIKKIINSEDIDWFLACFPDELLTSDGKIKPNLKGFIKGSNEIKGVMSEHFYPKNPDYYKNRTGSDGHMQRRMNMEFRWFMKYPLELLNRYPRKEIPSKNLAPVLKNLLNNNLKYEDRNEIGWRPPIECVFRGIILLGKSKDGNISYIIEIDPGHHHSPPLIVFYRLTYNSKGQLLTLERLTNKGEECGNLMKDFCTDNALGYMITFNFYFPHPFFYPRSSNPQMTALNSGDQIINEITKIILQRAEQDKKDKKLRNKMQAISQREIAELKKATPNYIKVVDTRYLENLSLEDLVKALKEIRKHRSKLKMSKELEKELGGGEFQNLEIYRYMDHSDYKDTVNEQIKHIQKAIEPKKEKHQLKTLYKLIPDFKTVVDADWSEDDNVRIGIENIKDLDMLIRVIRGIKKHREIWEGKESEEFVRMIYDDMRDRALRLKRIRSNPK